MIHNRIALAPYLVLLACVIGGLLSYRADQKAAHQQSGQAAAPLQLDLSFSLTDQSGQHRVLSDYQGRFLLVYFGFTQCPDVCPTTLAMIADALEKAGPKAAKLTPVLITVDPARDTPEMLKTYLAHFGENFVGLTGSEAEIKATLRRYGAFAAKAPIEGGGYSMDHTNTLYLIGPDGSARKLYTEMIRAEALAADLQKQL